MITTEQIKELRDKTGISVMQCRKALEEAGGDMEQALLLLRQKSGEIADKKSERELGAGVIQSYVHSSGTIGAIVELNCETDFVAKNPEFKTLAYDIAMHIAAASPEYIERADATGTLDEKALNDQTFIKDPSLSVGDLIKTFVQKFGEKIAVGKFTRLSVLGK